MLEAQLTNIMIGGFFEVYRHFGYGFLEAPYANALATEFQFRGLEVVRELPFELTYRGAVVGSYRADMIVCGRVLVEVKSNKQLTEADERQLQTYLMGSKVHVGLLFNFGPKPEFRRRVYGGEEG